MRRIMLEDRGAVVCIRATHIIGENKRRDVVICGMLASVHGETLDLTRITVYERLTVPRETIDYSCRRKRRMSINPERTPCEISISRKGNLAGVRRMIISAHKDGVLLASEERDALALVRELQK